MHFTVNHLFVVFRSFRSLYFCKCCEQLINAKILAHELYNNYNGNNHNLICCIYHDSIAHGTGLETCHVLLWHAILSHTPQACFEECLEFTPFWAVFHHGKDAVSRFFDSLQRTKVTICCCTVLRVLQWLAGVYVERFTTF